MNQYKITMPNGKIAILKKIDYCPPDYHTCLINIEEEYKQLAEKLGKVNK